MSNAFEEKVEKLVGELQTITERYKRITQKRLNEVHGIIKKIQEAIEGVDKNTVENIEIEVEGKTFSFQWIRSKIGSWFNLVDENGKLLPAKADKIGSWAYLHGDIDTYVEFMDKDTTFTVIKNFPAIIGEFAKEMEKILTADIAKAKQCDIAEAEKTAEKIKDINKGKGVDLDR